LEDKHSCILHTAGLRDKDGDAGVSISPYGLAVTTVLKGIVDWLPG